MKNTLDLKYRLYRSYSLNFALLFLMIGKVLGWITQDNGGRHARCRIFRGATCFSGKMDCA